MKRFFLPLLAMLLCLASCQKDDGLLYLDVEHYSNDAKLHLDAQHYAVWDDGDEILLNSQEMCVHVSGSQACITDVPSSSEYIAYYPADLTTHGMPAVQHYRTNSQGVQVLDAPMSARCGGSGNRLQFKNLGSILAVKVTNTTDADMHVRTIEVTDLNNHPLCGTASVNAETHSLAIVDGASTVTLDCADVCVPVGGDKIFCISLPAVSEAQFRIIVRDDAFAYTRTQTSNHTAFIQNSVHQVPFNTDDCLCEQYAPTACQIWYTTADGSTMAPFDRIPGYSSAWNPVSNTYENGRGVLTFGSPVDSIPGWAFLNEIALKTVVLPYNTTEIGNSAFTNCTTLVSIKMPKVYRLGEGSFNGCSSLTDVDLSEVALIGSRSFYNCSALTAVNLPKATAIPTLAFSDCSRLATATLPEATSIGDNAFTNCSSLVSVSMPKTTTIGEHSFQNCSMLTQVDLSSATSIESYAFNHTGLTSISLPRVTFIGEHAFSYCAALTQVGAPIATNIGGNVFSYCSNLESASIPAVTSIPPYTFFKCSLLTTVTISDYVTSIGEGAFRGCSSLSTISIPSVTIINKDAFQDCSSLGSMSLPRVTAIKDNAFAGCTNLTAISIPQIAEIRSFAFSFDSRLASIYCNCASDSSPYLDRNAFSNVPQNATLYLPNGHTGVADHWINYAWGESRPIVYLDAFPF